MQQSSELHAEASAFLPADVDLHARPAGLFVREACRFAAAITVSANGKSANAKSILEVLALGATGGTELALTASGEDAADAVAGLAQAVAALA
jgi:phosphotransferase system HPr (HPr) family protein